MLDLRAARRATQRADSDGGGVELLGGTTAQPKYGPACRLRWVAWIPWTSQRRSQHHSGADLWKLERLYCGRYRHYHLQGGSRHAVHSRGNRASRLYLVLWQAQSLPLGGLFLVYGG